MIIEKLIRKDLQITMSISKNELRRMCAIFPIQDGTKDETFKIMLPVLSSKDSCDSDFSLKTYPH